jgi:Uma2 family endonuclease
MKRPTSLAELPEQAIRIPATATTLAGFREWVMSDDFPEHGRISYVQGEIFLDMSPEELDTHNKIKYEVSYAIIKLNKELDLGEFHGDGMLLLNDAAGLSTEPDGAFATWESYEAGRVRLIERRRRPGQYTELQGTPDWVLEVVSRSSVEKDTKSLREAYHRAGIPEYWIIDARSEAIDFQILRYRRDRYVAVSPREGWLRSRVFGRGFLLERQRNRQGRWSYTLRVTPE